MGNFRCAQNDSPHDAMKLDRVVGTALARPRPSSTGYIHIGGTGLRRAKAVPTVAYLSSILLYVPIILTVFSLAGTLSGLQKVMYRLRQSAPTTRFCRTAYTC